MDTICPYLGLPGDRQVHYGYPNSLNVCYAVQAGWSTFRPVESGHQRQFCLSADHRLCPTFLSQAAPARAVRTGRAETYLDFFGLREEPFSIVPQPRFFHESESQREAHTGLRWLIDHRQGLGVLYGSVGTGKTALCHTLYEELIADPQILPIQVLTPTYHSEYALLADLLARWHVRPAHRRSAQHLEAAAHHFLAQAVLEREQTPVLMIDEAQNLPRALLQQVCTLLNWQDGGHQLLQVILAGQPGLQGRLSRVPALRDRAVVSFCLAPMTPADVQTMIQKRLGCAGRRGDLFAPSAIQLIHQHTGGLPRRVTILCLLCLWLAYQEGDRFITAEGVQAVIDRAQGGDLFTAPGEAAAQLAAAWTPKDGRGPAWLPRPLRRLWTRLA